MGGVSLALIIVDSLVGCLCGDFAERGTLLESRPDLLQALQQLDWVSKEHDLAVVITSQLVPDPVATDMGLLFEGTWDCSALVPLGGSTLSRFSTLRLVLEVGVGCERQARLLGEDTLRGARSAFEIYSGGVREVPRCFGLAH